MNGPPGTGKSRLARYIADELGLELYVARLDGLISSYLGSTSKNIRALFDFAAKTPCVLFLDEFDAIAKVRSDGQELGELKRELSDLKAKQPEGATPQPAEYLCQHRYRPDQIDRCCSRHRHSRPAGEGSLPWR